MPRKVVIVGGGFGGLACARSLAEADVEVTLIDKENHFLFQPLLYQVATAGLSPANIAWPIRSLLWKQKNVTVLMAEVLDVDLDLSHVKTAEQIVPFDELVIATGARHGYFGHDDWEKNATGIKSLKDATAMRSKILLAFEEAETAQDLDEREALLTIVIVGGGPTGVEMAGSLAELAKRTLARDFRHIDPTKTKIILVEGKSVLAEFPEKLQAAAVAALRDMGVEVRLGEMVEAINDQGVQLPSGWIKARTVIWAAGVQASPAKAWLGAESDKAGRLIVDDHCRVRGRSNIYAIGDVAAFYGDDGRLLPGTCPAAIQQGNFVAKLIQGRQVGEFRYVDKGILATIGRSRAVARIGKLQFSGFVAWVLWLGLHLWQLLSGQSRIIVFVQWVWAYVSFSRGARLITQLGDRSKQASTGRP